MKKPFVMIFAEPFSSEKALASDLHYDEVAQVLRDSHSVANTLTHYETATGGHGDTDTDTDA